MGIRGVTLCEADMARAEKAWTDLVRSNLHDLFGSRIEFLIRLSRIREESDNGRHFLAFLALVDKYTSPEGEIESAMEGGG